MKIVKADYEIIDELDGAAILKKIERIARVCYKSEDKISDGSAEKMVAALIKSGHEAMLEHFSFSVKFTVDRGISHEIVRHRLASYAQESTRYCNYSGDKFGAEITVICPVGPMKNINAYSHWEWGCKCAEKAYFQMIANGASPQMARSTLPTSLKTEIVMTTNLREWRHFFKLRAAGTTGRPHPQMLEVMVPLLYDLRNKIPVVFDDIDIAPEDMDLMRCEDCKHSKDGLAYCGDNCRCRSKYERTQI